MSKKEEEQRRHEFFLMEVRLTGEDTKNAIAEKLEKRLVPLENRMTSLEHYRTAIGASIAAILAWLKFGYPGKG